MKRQKINSGRSENKQHLSHMTKPTNKIQKPNDVKKYRWAYLVFGIILITIITYAPISRNKFLNWDDNLYVTENPNIQNFSSENLYSLFTHNYVSNYLPLTMLSYTFDYKIGSLNPKVFTLTNLILHIFNSIFVFWLVVLLAESILSPDKNVKFDTKSTYLLGFITAILFAVHPMNVESVAWISERKNLLYAFFFLLSIINYVLYLKKGNPCYYLLSILFFIFSLLSKGVAVSLSLCIVIIDYFFQRKLISKKVIIEKIPFIVLSLIFGIITIRAQKSESALVGAVNFPFYKQFSFASYGFINYLSKLLIPANLSAYYSYPLRPSSIHWICMFLALLMVTLLIRFRKIFNRLVIFSILFYLANIIFLIQILPVGNAIMAERYIYVSSIGFFLLLAVLFQKMANRYSVMYFILATIIVFYAFTSHQRLKVWNNSLAFWDDVIAKDKHIPRAWNNRGIIRNEKGDYPGAIDDFDNAIQIMPEYQEAFNNRGIVYFNLKKDDEAILDFTKAIQLDTLYADAYYNRGTVRNNMNDLQGALLDLNHALRLNPGKLDAYLNRADVKIKQNENESAIKDCEAVLERNKNISNAYAIEASAYYNMNRFEEAIEEYTKALVRDPNNINYYHNRGAAYYYSGKYRKSIGDMNTVLQNNSIAISYYIRGMANIKLGNTMDGCNDLHKAASEGLMAAGNELKTYCNDRP